MKRKQRTIAKEVTMSGRGLHTGVDSAITLRPAEAGTGIVFRLQKDNSVTEIPVTPKTTGPGLHRTCASVNGSCIETVEHLLAGIAGNWIDNLYIDITATEPPGGDGSAAKFCELVAEAGITEQDEAAKAFVLTKPITVSDGQGGIISAVPYKPGLKLTYTVDYPQSKLAQGTVEFDISPETFLSEVSSARTFCLEEHVEPMRALGCGQGASTENTLVLKGDEVLENTLRFDDECARHKLLDLLGDISVVGRPLCMHIIALRGGHKLNAEFVKELSKEIFRSEHPKGLMDIRDIEDTLPHRYPFLLVDRILEMEPGVRVVGMKNVTRNEEFFNGHFPGQPVMPGVLHVEAMAQTGGIMMLQMPDLKGKNVLAVLMSVDGVKYRRPVVPGDQMVMEIIMEKCKGRIGQVKCYARVDGEVATEATIKFAVVDAKDYT